MIRLPDDEKTLCAQALVLEIKANSSREQPFYSVSPDSAQLTEEEQLQLQAYERGLIEKYGDSRGANTLTVKKLADGTWVGRRATWVQDWSSVKESLEVLLAKI